MASRVLAIAVKQGQSHGTLAGDDPLPTGCDVARLGDLGKQRIQVGELPGGVAPTIGGWRCDGSPRRAIPTRSLIMHKSQSKAAAVACMAVKDRAIRSVS
jgi:hypothetical protein